MTVKEIEKAITELPPPKLREFVAWFEEFEANLTTSANDAVSGTADLQDEIADWEAASDEDMIRFEKTLAEIG